MIDFEALVLGPCQDAFSRPVTVTPLASQPGQPAYQARGIWRAPQANVALEDGSVMNSQDLILGMKRGDMTVPVLEGDQIEIDTYLSLPRIGVCLIDRINKDGIGDMQIVLKITGP